MISGYANKLAAFIIFGNKSSVSKLSLVAVVAAVIIKGYPHAVGRRWDLFVDICDKVTRPLDFSPILSLGYKSLRDLFLSRSFDYESMRGKFRRMPLTVGTPRDTHPHGNAAAARYTANRAATALFSDLQPYCLSMSATDVRQGLDGRHDYYQWRDFAKPRKHDRITDGHFIKAIDVDYYVDPEYLFHKCVYSMGLFSFNFLSVGVKHLRPIMLYTFSPLEPSGTDGELTWFWNGNNLVTEVSGGGVFEHQLYDWSPDYVTFSSWGFTVCYKVDTRRIKTHLLVLLTPHVWVSNLSSVQPAPLRRIKPEFTGNTAILTTPKGCYIMRKNTPSCVLLPQKVFNAIRIMMSNAKTPYLTHVERFVNSDKRLAHIDAADCALIFEALCTNKDGTKYPLIDTLNYQSPGPLVTEEGKPEGKRTGDPVIEGASVPAKSYNNDVECIKTRVEIPQQDLPKALDAVTNKHAIEFVKQLGIRPVAQEDLDEIMRRQTRPTQVENIAKAIPMAHSKLSKKNVKAFQKSETYTKPTNPRNISTLDPATKLGYSGIMYPIMDWMKTQSWYGFGMDPDGVATRVHQVMLKCQFVVETDFSRFDGTVSPAARLVEKRILEEFYPKNPLAIKYWKMGINCPATTTNGVRYNTGSSRLSGSPETSAFNTILNAFVAYSALRRAGQGPNKAFEALGIYGGDDGLTGMPSTDTANYVEAAAALGFKLKIAAKASYLPCTFLGRVFTQPRDHKGSIADPVRHLTKINVTAGSVNDHLLQLANKWQGLLTTDPNMPLLSDYCIAGLKHSKINKFGDLGFWAQFNTPFEPPPREEVMEYLETTLGINVAVEIERIAKSKSLEDLFSVTYP